MRSSIKRVGLLVGAFAFLGAGYLAWQWSVAGPMVVVNQPEQTADPKRDRIKGLIADLAKLDQPDFGFSSTISGDAFAPIPGQEHMSTALWTDHKLKSTDKFKILVELGPEALPHLLDALDDQTPTKIVVKHSGGMGGMWHESDRDLGSDEYLDSYTLKVGDLCYVAIGQIVGESYRAVRYQPTACIILACPTHTPELCKQVRAAWHSQDARATLLRSLQSNYSAGSVRARSGSAMRLLFYFPDQSAPLIAEDLGKLDVGAEGEPHGAGSRRKASGGRTDEYIKAVSWCKHPLVVKALQDLFKRAQETPDLLAALPGVEDKTLIRTRLQGQLAKLPPDDTGPYGEGSHLLIALGQRVPDHAQAAFERYL